MGCVCAKGCCNGGGAYDIAGRRLTGEAGREGEWRVRGQHIMRVLAQVMEMVNVLENDESDQSSDNSSSSSSIESNKSDDEFNWLWNPMCDCPVHISVACIQEGMVYEYTVYAEEKDLCPFSSNITIPGTDIKRTGPFFVQWKDVYSGKVYGLNFFTESDALRFISSCFPPSYTPDTCIRHTSSRPSYISPPPPPPLSQRPDLALNEDSAANYNPRYGFDYFTSTPIQDSLISEGYFKPPTAAPLHAINSLTPVGDNGDNNNNNSNNHDNEVSLLAYLPRPLSVISTTSSEGFTGGDATTHSLPSPPSLFQINNNNNDDNNDDNNIELMIDSNNKTKHELNDTAMDSLTVKEESTNEEDSSLSFIDDPELFEATEPLQVNKILEDIIEEEEEEEGEEDKVKTLKRTVTDPVKVSPQVMEQCLADFDDFLKDIRKSQLLEITDRESRLSRQSSFTAPGPPPLLPPTPPPGPTLLPKHSNPFLSQDFQNALKRLSIHSDSAEGDNNNNQPTLQHSLLQGEGYRDSFLPPPLNREDSEEVNDTRSRAFSFRNYPQPPDGFSSDSGLHFSSDNEIPLETERRLGQFILREPDTRTISSQPSETTESLGIVNYPSNLALREETSAAAGDDWSKSDSIKKTGWLEVKGVLVRKNRKVAMKSTRRWKSHWAVLKGKHLLLNRWDKGPHSPTNEHILEAKIDITQSLAHSVHDHIKRDHLFCLSTSNGNTYYMQTISQAAVEEWIHSIHSAAAMDLTGQTNRETAIETLKALNEESEETIEKEKQMKNLTELQLTTISDSTSKANITKQLASISENIEKHQVTIYRNRCYLASLHHIELPNPQPLLACVSKPTKTTLNKVGNFSISSLHAVVNVRSSTNTKAPNNELGQSPTWSHASTSTTTSTAKKKRHFRFFGRREEGEKNKAKRRLFGSLISDPVPTSQGMEPHLLTYRQLLEPNPLATGFGATLMVQVPDKKVCSVPFRLDLTVDDILFTCCKKFGLDPADHFLKLTTSGNNEEIPHEEEFIVNLTFTNLEIAQKFIKTVQFDTTPQEDIGLNLRPDLRNLGSVTHVMIESVLTNSQAKRLGLNEGDEVVLINDTSVAHMTWNEVTAMIAEPKFSLTVRTRHYQVPVGGVAGRTTHFHLRDLVCPSPPVQRKEMSVKKLDELIVPRPSIAEDLSKIAEDSSGSLTPSESEDNMDPNQPLEEDRVHQLIKGSLEVTGLVDRWKAYEEAAAATIGTAATTGGGLSEDESISSPPMSPQHKMIKCVSEIVESEKDHVKSLEILTDRYLEPMKLEAFLPRDKITAICDSVLSVVVQQKQFLGRIEELPNISSENTKRLVQEISGAFMVHLDTFKQYSQFCAAQNDIENIFINVQDRQKLEEFLEARNPKQSPSLTINSLLTKPVLRLLRYPLFLQALKDLSPKYSDEHQILTETLTHVTMVTEYINEVKRVAESYCDVFDIILTESGLIEFGISVRISELLCHMTVMWLNPSIGRGWRKGQGPEMHCFVFNSNVMLLHVEQSVKVKRRPSKASLTHEPISMDDITHKALLPLAQCKVNDLPDSDGVSSMWQIVQKGRDLTSPAITYTLRSKSAKEKTLIMDALQGSIQAQLALYTNISGSMSPVKYRTANRDSLGSPSSHDSYMTNSTPTVRPPKLSSLVNSANNNSVDSEYELTLL